MTPLDSSQPKQPSPVVFFGRCADLAIFSKIEFYREDIEALRALGFDPTLIRRNRDVLRLPDGAFFAWWQATALPAVLWWRLFRKGPVILTGAHDLASPLNHGARHLLRKFATLVCCRLAHVNLGISESEAHALRKWGIEVVTVPCSVETDFYCRPDKDPIDYSIVTVAQINPLSIHRKGLDLALQAAQIARQTYPEIVYTLAGPITAEGQNWIESSKARGLLEGVKVTGEVSRTEKLVILQRSQVYLQPSRHEGFGLAVVEAMACGVIPVVTNVGSLPEVTGKAGVVSENSTPESIAKAIVQALGMAPRGRQVVRESAERYSRTNRVALLRKVFESVGLNVSDHQTTDPQIGTTHGV